MPKLCQNSTSVGASLGELKRSPRPTSRNMGPTSKGSGGMEEGGGEREGGVGEGEERKGTAFYGS